MKSKNYNNKMKLLIILSRRVLPITLNLNFLLKLLQKNKMYFLKNSKININLKEKTII